jgi:hypothetical protein
MRFTLIGPTGASKSSNNAMNPASVVIRHPQERLNSNNFSACAAAKESGSAQHQLEENRFFWH